MVNKVKRNRKMSQKLKESMGKETPEKVDDIFVLFSWDSKPSVSTIVSSTHLNEAQRDGDGNRCTPRSFLPKDNLKVLNSGNIVEVTVVSTGTKEEMRNAQTFFEEAFQEKNQEILARKNPRKSSPAESCAGNSKSVGMKKKKKPNCTLLEQIVAEKEKKEALLSEDLESSDIDNSDEDKTYIPSPKKRMYSNDEDFKHEQNLNFLKEVNKNVTSLKEEVLKNKVGLFALINKRFDMLQGALYNAVLTKTEDSVDESYAMKASGSGNQRRSRKEQKRTANDLEYKKSDNFDLYCEKYPPSAKVFACTDITKAAYAWMGIVYMDKELKSGMCLPGSACSSDRRELSPDRMNYIKDRLMERFPTAYVMRKFDEVKAAMNCKLYEAKRYKELKKAGLKRRGIASQAEAGKNSDDCEDDSDGTSGGGFNFKL